MSREVAEVAHQSFGAMGLANESERAEFEQYCAQFPALVAARRKFEEEIEQYAAGHAAIRPGCWFRFFVSWDLRQGSPPAT